MSTSAEQWRRALVERLGLDAPSDGERSDRLALAGVAAHASERTAVPIACWMAARAGMTPREVLEVTLTRTAPETLED